MIHAVDNLLGNNHFLYAQAKFTDPAIHWYYLPYTANPSDLEHLPAYAGSFSHLVYKEGEAVSPLADAAIHILLTACDRTQQQLDRVIRIRLGLSTRTPVQIQHAPHVDQQYSHRAGIWYPVTSSGDTVIFTETVRSKTYTEWYRQTPTANSWIDFPGEHFHSSTTPDQHESRIVLNFNYTVKNR